MELLEQTLNEMLPVADNVGGFQIKDFDEILKTTRDFIADKQCANLVIDSDSTMRQLKLNRTEIRKNAELVKKLRQQFVAMYVSTLEQQFKQLEKELAAADKDLKERIDAYNDAQKPTEPAEPKETVYTLTIKSTNLAQLEQFKRYAESSGLKGEIK